MTKVQVCYQKCMIGPTISVQMILGLLGIFSSFDQSQASWAKLTHLSTMTDFFHPRINKTPTVYPLYCILSTNTKVNLTSTYFS